jgi:hypothetical protein
MFIMDLEPHTSRIRRAPPKASQEALRQIVEVFRVGHQAAVDLRDTAGAMAPSQLAVELEEIEERMLIQISHICDCYHLEETLVPRN